MENTEQSSFTQIVKNELSYKKNLVMKLKLFMKRRIKLQKI